MDLFICHTPLQAKIAMRVIEEQGIANYHVFYFSHVKNDTQLKYYNQLSANAQNATFYICEARFPKYFSVMKNIFKGKRYSNVYVASIDNIYVHLALTHCRFEQLNTFDDGGANIDQSSLYYVSERSWFSEFIYYVFGSRYSLNKVKLKSKKHFSIYKGRPNIVSPIVYIDLFSKPVVKNGSVELQKECTVFLGSYFNYISKNGPDLLLEKLAHYFGSKESVFYIPHPMETSEHFSQFSRLEKGKLAEDLILELAERYEKVNVYGIASSALFNLLDIPSINVNTIVSSELTDNCNSLSQTLADSGGNVFHLE